MAPPTMPVGIAQIQFSFLERTPPNAPPKSPPATNEQLKTATKENLDVDNILRQSSARYNNLFTVKLSITIPGDFGLNAGDLVYCDFPEISDQNDQKVSSRNSGIYMIVDLCHYINSNPKITGIAGRCFTRLNLVRDSFGRKTF